MSVYKNNNYTSFQAVNLRGSGGIRFDFSAGSIGTVAGTLTVPVSNEGLDRSWTLPDKSGAIGVTGTVLINLPVVSASSYLQTVVTIAGVRVEDAVILTPQNTNGGAAVLSARGALFVADATPSNGTVTVTLVNAFATATIARDCVFAYTLLR